jgi:MFS family permease
MFFGWRVVAGSFVGMMLSLGFFSYTFTLFVTPLRDEFGVGLEPVMYSLTLGTLLGLIVSPLAGILVDRISVRAFMVAGCVIIAAGFWAMSMANSIGMFNIAFAITFSLGNGIVGPVASGAVVSRWFVRSRGRAMGITTMGTSVGGLVMPAIATWWIASEGWRGALENFALLALLIVAPWIALNIRNRPSDLGLQPDGDGVEANQNTAPAAATNPPGMAEIVRRREFWLIGLSVGFLVAAFSATLANLSPYAIELGASKVQASSLIMAVAITGLIGKLLFGMAADYFSLKWGLWASQALVGVALLLMVLQPPYTVVVIAALCLGFATGGLLPVWNSMMALVFGVDSFGRAMGAMGPLITLLVMPAYILIGRLHDLHGNYTTSLAVFIGLIVLAILLLLPVRLPEAGQS